MGITKRRKQPHLFRHSDQHPSPDTRYVPTIGSSLGTSQGRSVDPKSPQSSGQQDDGVPRKIAPQGEANGVGQLGGETSALGVLANLAG